MPSIRHAFLALALAGAFSLVPSARAAAPTPIAAAPDLIVAAEPAASDALNESRATGAITLSYRVLEIFAGEPGAATIVVRHEALAPDERARLLPGERVILLARRDGAVEGRWVASAPLRATPAALAAFRRWSAPEDVRAAAPLDDVLAEVARGDARRPAVSGATAPPLASPPPAASDAAEPVERAREASPASAPLAEALPAPEPAAAPPPPSDAGPEQVDEDRVVVRREVEARPAQVPDVAEPPAPPAASSASEAPRAAAAPKPDPPAEASLPPTGPGLQAQAVRGAPGLPPVPAGRILGTPLEARSDLTPPLRGGRGR